MAELFANDPGTTLNGAINNSTTTIVVTSATGYPSSGNFRIRIDSELMLVTAVSGATWTVVRGIESTSAASHNNAAAVNHIVTAGSVTNIGSGFNVWGPTYDSTCRPSAQSFSWRNQGSATETANGDCLYLLAPAVSGDQLRCREITAPATPYTITIGMIPHLHEVAYNSSGMYFADNGTGKVTTLIWRNGALEIAYFTNATTYSSTPVTIGMTSSNSMIWLRLTDNGTNHIGSWSSNGVFFHDIYNVSRTTHLATTDRVGYYCNSSNASYPAGVMLTYWKQS